MTFADREPVWTAGTIVALVTAAVAVAAAFGLPITDDQRTAILSLVGVLAPLAVMLLVRPNVVPVARIEATPVAEAALKRAEVAE